MYNNNIRNETKGVIKMKYQVKIPKAYKRNLMTKLLWLYKNNVITYTQYTESKSKLINK